MCIVLDINILPSVLDPNSSDHGEFSEVHKCLMSRRGMIVIGGTKYINELKKCLTYLKYMVELNKQKRLLVLISDNEVDKYQKELEKIITSSDCDDHHLIALLAISGCCLLCSKDRRSFNYIKNNSYYPKTMHDNVKIYTCAKNAPLLQYLQKNSDLNCVVRSSSTVSDTERLNLRSKKNISRSILD